MCCRACCYRGPPRITPKHIAPDHITWYRVVPNLQELGGLNNTATGPRLLSSLQSVSNSATQAAEFGLRLHLDLHLQLRAHTDIQPKQNRSVDASPCGVKDCSTFAIEIESRLYRLGTLRPTACIAYALEFHRSAHRWPTSRERYVPSRCFTKHFPIQPYSTTNTFRTKSELSEQTPRPATATLLRK
ncbi:hypothetical protein ECG_02855 [Echinococcus granulosus]|nr:hypothetical protein ECG_02855 [Echinococcus granulosus]